MKLQKFDYQLNDNKKNKSIITVAVGLVLLVAGIVIYKSFAAYKVTESYNIIKGNVASFTKDNFHITYNLVDENNNMMTTGEIPSNQEYEYDATRSSCVGGNTLNYDSATNSFIIDNTVVDNCNAYFNYIPLSLQTFYALGYTKSDIKTGVPYGNGGTAVEGWYEAEDNYGTSYYYYSANSLTRPQINTTKSSWNIIRINGNGTIRVIDLNVNGLAKYNELNNDNAYVGYKFGQIGATNILNTHDNLTDSTAKTFIENNLSFKDVYDTENALYDDSTYFCNDRSLYKEEYGTKEIDDTALGTSGNTTYYGAYYRLKNNTPSLKCNIDDSFSKTESDNGNGNLTLAMGLITADEIYMTGYAWLTQNNLTPFSMSPAMFKNQVAYNYMISDANVGLEAKAVSEDGSMVFVTNLKADLNYNKVNNNIFEVIQ